MRQTLAQRLTRYLCDTYLLPYLVKVLPSVLTWRYACVGDVARLSIAPGCQVNNALFNLYSGTITLEENVFFGYDVQILTGTHDYTKIDAERIRAVPASGRDILIRRGAWIASRVTIIGPCTIGRSAVVCAGAVVNRDVADGTIVAGIPARPIGKISADAAAADDIAAG